MPDPRLVGECPTATGRQAQLGAIEEEAVPVELALAEMARSQACGTRRRCIDQDLALCRDEGSPLDLLEEHRTLNTNGGRARGTDDEAQTGSRCRRCQPML
jgi:hypothetical protein